MHRLTLAYLKLLERAFQNRLKGTMCVPLQMRSVEYAMRLLFEEKERHITSQQRIYMLSPGERSTLVLSWVLWSCPEFQDFQNKTLAVICRELGFDFAQSDELKRNFFQTNFPLCAIRPPQLERRAYAALARSFW